MRFDRKQLEDDANYLSEQIGSHSSIIVMGHKSPDGDCVSSVCLSVEYIERMFGQMADGLILDRIPDRLKCIPRSEWICSERDFIDEATGDELLLIVDCASLNGLGLSDEEIRKFKTSILIDHHGVGRSVSDCVTRAIVYPEFSSCSHLLYKLFSFEGRGWIDRYVARAFYIGMNTDTLGFTVSKVDYELFDDLGYITTRFEDGDIEEINKSLYRSNPMSIIEHKVKVLSNLKFRMQDNGIGKIGYVVHDTEYTPPELSSLTIPLFNDIYGYEVCYYIKAVSNNRTRISIRSRNQSIDVSKVMSELFGGGGHKGAAGALVDKPSTEVEKIIHEYDFNEVI